LLLVAKTKRKSQEMALMRLKSCYENCRTGLHEKILLGRSFARLSCSGDAFDRVGCFSSVYIFSFSLTKKIKEV